MGGKCRWKKSGRKLLVRFADFAKGNVTTNTHIVLKRPLQLATPCVFKFLCLCVECFVLVKLTVD